MRALLLTLALAAPAAADTGQVVRDHIRRGFAAFAEAAGALAGIDGCEAEVLRSAFQSAWDAWMGWRIWRLDLPRKTGGGWLSFTGLIRRLWAGRRRRRCCPAMLRRWSPMPLPSNPSPRVACRRWNGFSTRQRRCPPTHAR